MRDKRDTHLAIHPLRRYIRRIPPKYLLHLMLRVAVEVQQTVAEATNGRDKIELRSYCDNSNARLAVKYRAERSRRLRIVSRNKQKRWRAISRPTAPTVCHQPTNLGTTQFVTQISSPNVLALVRLVSLRHEAAVRNKYCGQRSKVPVDQLEDDDAYLERLRRIDLPMSASARAQVGLFGDEMPTQKKPRNGVKRHSEDPRGTPEASGAALTAAGSDLLRFAGGKRFGTILADPPWQFQNKTGKVAPEHKRLSRYSTMTLEDIKRLPVDQITDDVAHLYLWVPNALLPDGLAVLQAWGFTYKGNIVWEKVRKDGGPDGRGVGFYFRNVTELILFGVKGKNARTRAAGRRQVNFIATRKREHSRKPDEQYPIIEACSHGPFLELFARGLRKNWTVWGNQADDGYAPTWKTYAHHSQVKLAAE